MMRRHAARLFAVIFGMVVIVSPAKAFVVAAPFVLTSSGTAIQVTAGSLASLFGSLLMALTIANDNGEEIRLPVSDDPGVATAMPAPAAPATATPQQGGTWVNSYYSQCNGGASADAVESCMVQSARNACVGNGYTLTQCQTSYPDGYFAGSATFQASGTVTCSAGYVLSGSSCILQNARVVTPDDKCDLQFSGTGAGSKYMYFDDVDCPGGATVDNGAFVPGLRSDGRTAFVSGKDAAGNPILIEVLVSDDGATTYVRHYTQTQTATETQVQTTQLTIDRATSRVRDVSTSTDPGHITQPTTNTLPTSTTTSPTATDTPTVQKEAQKVEVETCGLPGKPACNVDDSGFPAEAPPLNVPDADLNVQKDKMESIVDPGFAASMVPSLLPGTATACHPLELRGAVNVGPAAGLDSTATLDICWMFEIGRAVLGYLFWLCGVLYVWRRFTGSNTAGVAA